MYYKTREEELAFMKKLWAGEATLCPKCQKAELILLHKRRRRVIMIGSVRSAKKYIVQLI